MLTRQLERFQEEVEEIRDPLHESRAERRGARELELKRKMAEISQHVQSKSRDAESSNLFISTKTRIKPLEVDIAEVMGENSHDAQLVGATMSQKSMLEHNILYQQCYSWLRQA